MQVVEGSDLAPDALSVDWPKTVGALLDEPVAIAARPPNERGMEHEPFGELSVLRGLLLECEGLDWSDATDDEQPIRNPVPDCLPEYLVFMVSDVQRC